MRPNWFQYWWRIEQLNCIWNWEFGGKCCPNDTWGPGRKHNAYSFGKKSLWWHQLRQMDSIPVARRPRKRTSPDPDLQDSGAGQTWPNMAKHPTEPAFFQMHTEGVTRFLFRSGVLGLQLRSLCAGLCPQPPTVGNSNTTVHTINASWRNLVLLSPYLRGVFCKRDLQDCSFEVLSLFKKGVDHDTGIDGVVHSMFCRIAVLQWPRRQKSVPKECSTRACVFPQENCCACIPTKAFKSFECCRSPLSKIIFRAWTATDVVQCSEECVEAYKTIFWMV